MTYLKGIPVILVDKVEIGNDDFGHPIHRDVEIEVQNVLVAPTSSEDVINQMNLTGKKAEYTLGIPKGDTNKWENREVKFFGRKWRTIGIPQEGIESMIPLSWHRKVMVEVYERYEISIDLGWRVCLATFFRNAGHFEGKRARDCK